MKHLLLLISWILFGSSLMAGPSSKMAGLSLVSPRNGVDGAWVLPIQQVNANWVAIMPYAFLQQGRPEIRYDLAHQWWGERPEGIRALVQQAKAGGMKVMLKPMVWVNGAWAGGFKLEQEEEWLKWEAAYDKYIFGLAEMAHQESVELICIGTELKEVSRLRPQYFRSLAERLHAQYCSQLTYAANWDEYEQIGFWDALDYVGVDAYFPLTASKLPKVTELRLAWRGHFHQLKKLAAKTQRQVIFTEFGYRSIDGCAWEQWVIESLPHNSSVNLQAQLNAYQAFFEIFWPQEWFAGVFFWQWYLHHERAGGKNNSDFTPQNKPAQDLVKAWFRS